MVGSYCRRIAGHTADYLMQVGREGERCSIAFEERRVGRRPEWQSIESNKSGFDLLSTMEQTDPTDLQIEVKASVRPLSAASMHVTRNEWETAQTAEQYLFHVWSLTDSGKRLAILSPEDIVAHVPSENGQGRWETVEIPCRAFATMFRPIALSG